MIKLGNKLNTSRSGQTTYVPYRKSYLPPDAPIRSVSMPRYVPTMVPRKPLSNVQVVSTNTESKDVQSPLLRIRDTVLYPAPIEQTQSDKGYFNELVVETAIQDRIANDLRAISKENEIEGALEAIIEKMHFNCQITISTETKTAKKKDDQDPTDMLNSLRPFQVKGEEIITNPSQMAGTSSVSPLILSSFTSMDSIPASPIPVTASACLRKLSKAIVPGVRRMPLTFVSHLVVNAAASASHTEAETFFIGAYLALHQLSINMFNWRR